MDVQMQWQIYMHRQTDIPASKYLPTFQEPISTPKTCKKFCLTDTNFPTDAGKLLENLQTTLEMNPH